MGECLCLWKEDAANESVAPGLKVGESGSDTSDEEAKNTQKLLDRKRARLESG